MDFDFDRSGRARQYTSIQKHHRTSRRKNANKWDTRDKELTTFDNADYGNITKTSGTASWLDDESNLWGFLQNFEIVGTRKEQFGFFPRPENQSDRWHGYPITPFTGHYKISKSLLESWVRTGILPESSVGDLLNGKKIR